MKYKSTYDRIIAEKKAEGKYHVFSEETCIKIMQELNSKIRRVHSELELKNINLK